MEGTKTTRKELTVYDEESGVILARHEWIGSQNGGKWMVFYRSTAALLASGKVSPAAVRVFLFLAAWCSWDGTWQGTKTELAAQVGLARKTVHESLNELKGWELIREGRKNGVAIFFINPDMVTQGRDKRKRMKVYEAVSGSSAAAVLNAMDSSGICDGVPF